MDLMVLPGHCSTARTRVGNINCHYCKACTMCWELQSEWPFIPKQM